MTALIKKELKSYFRSFKGYIFIALGILSLGISTYAFNINGGISKIEYPLWYMTISLSLIAPITVSGCFSKERKKKTEQLLFSLSLKASDIVFGKYFATLCLFGFEIALIMILPLIFSIFGAVNFASAYLAIFGLILFAAALFAICLYIDAVFKNQIWATVISYLALAAMFAIGIIPTIRTSSLLYAITAIANQFSFFGGFNSFYMGMLNLNVIINYLSIIVVFLFLSIRAVEKRRRKFGGEA